MPLHVRDLGSGPPVVFLHPGPGLDGSVFLPGAQRVADAGFRVLLVDLPGQRPLAGRRLDARGLGRGGRGLRRTSSVCEDWTLLGHSFGGYVAMQHVVDYGDRHALCRLVHRRRGGAGRRRSTGSLREHVAGGRRGVRARGHGERRRRSAARCGATSCRSSPTTRPPSSRCSTASSSSPRPTTRTSCGELHALGALAAFDGPVLAIAGERRPRARRRR